MNEVIFMLLIGLISLVLQTTSLGFLLPPDYKPDLFLILVVWASLRLSFVVGILFSFIAGMLIDVMSGSPIGLFSLLYCSIFVFSGYSNETVHLDVPSGRGITVLTAGFFIAIMVLLSRWVEASYLDLTGPVLWWIFLKIVITALAAVPLFSVLDAFWAGFERIVGIR